jgi:hypothetical protein
VSDSTQLAQSLLKSLQPAYNEIVKLMARSSWPRFMHSKYYQEVSGYVWLRVQVRGAYPMLYVYCSILHPMPRSCKRRLWRCKCDKLSTVDRTKVHCSMRRGPAQSTASRTFESAFNTSLFLPTLVCWILVSYVRTKNTSPVDTKRSVVVEHILTIIQHERVGVCASRHTMLNTRFSSR